MGQPSALIVVHSQLDATELFKTNKYKDLKNKERSDFMPENCAVIVIAAKHGDLIKVKDYKGVANTVGALRCRFEFRTSDWDNSTVTAVFCKGNVVTHPEIIDTPVGVVLDGDNECAVPSEVLTPDAKYFSVGIWGVTESGLRIVSVWLVFDNRDGCYVDASAPIEPTPDVYEQIMAILNNKSNVGHSHDDRYFTKDESDERYLTLEDLDAAQVTSVNKQTGAVVLTATDVGAFANILENGAQKPTIPYAAIIDAPDLSKVQIDETKLNSMLKEVLV